jgi:fatty acid desaturase
MNRYRNWYKHNDPADPKSYELPPAEAARRRTEKAQNLRAFWIGVSIIVALVQAIFLVLKQTAVIDWAWYWVLSPVLGPVALMCVLGLVAILIVVSMGPFGQEW